MVLLGVSGAYLGSFLAGLWLGRETSIFDRFYACALATAGIAAGVFALWRFRPRRPARPDLELG